MAESTIKFTEILKVLVEHEVEFIVVGGVCAVLHGAPVSTFDLDIVHSRAPENLERLLAAVEELQAIYREQAHRRIQPGISHLRSPGHQLLDTKFGKFDLLGTISNDLDYDDLLPKSVVMKFQNGLNVRVLDLPTLIAFKEEAGRDKDKAVLPVLKQTLAEQEKLQ